MFKWLDGYTPLKSNGILWDLKCCSEVRILIDVVLKINIWNYANISLFNLKF